MDKAIVAWTRGRLRFRRRTPLSDESTIFIAGGKRWRCSAISCGIIKTMKFWCWHRGPSLRTNTAPSRRFDSGIMLDRSKNSCGRHTGDTSCYWIHQQFLKRSGCQSTCSEVVGKVVQSHGVRHTRETRESYIDSDRDLGNAPVEDNYEGNFMKENLNIPNIVPEWQQSKIACHRCC